MRFTYEAPYAVDTASSAYRQYRPDFHLPDHDLYIEHFALDEADRAPPGWRGYAEGVAWKRSLHEQHGTRLIESYSWERGRGVLLKRLREKLQAAGVRLQPMSEGEAVRELAGWQLSRLAQLLGAAIHHLKSSAATRGALEERAARSADRRRSELFLRILHELRERYERRLREAGERDFHDLIAQAAGVLRSDRPATAYSHVLVDEFQDISQDRLRLLEALGGRGACFFLVGDDWQSSMRVELTARPTWRSFRCLSYGAFYEGRVNCKTDVAVFPLSILRRLPSRTCAPAPDDASDAVVSCPGK